jgi:hypothetical protein
MFMGTNVKGNVSLLGTRQNWRGFSFYGDVPAQ